MNKPPISIIMPLYNDERNLEKAIQSIINQTYKTWELIIVDDCSKDNSYSIAKKYASKNKKIKLYQTDKNMGVAYTRDLGIKKAKFDWVANTDSDIIAPPDWIDNASKETKNFLIFGGPVKYNLPKKGYLKKASFYLESNLFPKKRQIYNKDENYSEPPIGGANLFIKKEIYFQLGGFDNNIKIGEDRLLLCDGLKEGLSILYDPQIIVSHPLYNYNNLSNFLNRGIFFTKWKNLLFNKNNLLEKPYKKIYLLLPVLLFIALLLILGKAKVILIASLVTSVFYLIALRVIKKVPIKYISGYVLLNFLRKTTSSLIYLFKLKPRSNHWK